MIIDNCPAHPQLVDLKAIKLIFLPPNTTSHLQPCDQGITNSFKHHYHTRVVRKYLDHIEDEMLTATTSTSTFADNFNISIIDALYDMRFAWEKVIKKMIKNCFRHAGFHKPSAKVKGADFETAGEEYPAIDYEVQTTAEMSIAEIVNAYYHKIPAGVRFWRRAGGGKYAKSDNKRSM
ncbi:tigger transposable element-derived protein [Plakobranchus ocellatus]|uniref:Tigger transposable element-derived protein n=1 Tax=Plakobranchus ocellatus TaxID=259542 RepID=A0AAV3Z7N7_9GAST|nr:tigger transposable element-derived protein [Plakobranchus ocellatus]